MHPDDIVPDSERRGLIAPEGRMLFRLFLRAAPQGSPQRPRPDQRLREGARLFTVAFGPGANTGLLLQMATSPAEAYAAPSPAQLADVYRRIAERLRAGSLFSSLQVTDEIPRNMAYVPGSAQPPGCCAAGSSSNGPA